MLLTFCCDDFVNLYNNSSLNFRFNYESLATEKKVQDDVSLKFKLI